MQRLGETSFKGIEKNCNYSNPPPVYFCATGLWETSFAICHCVCVWLPVHAWCVKALWPGLCNWLSSRHDIPVGPPWSIFRSQLEPVHKPQQTACIHKHHIHVQIRKQACVGRLWKAFKIVFIYLKTSLSCLTLLSGYFLAQASSRKALAYASGPALTWRERSI